MRIVIPISASDAPKLPKLIKVINKLGGLYDHSILIVPTKSQEKAAFDAKAELKDTCPEIAIFGLDHDPMGDWPRACNIHFFHAASYVAALPGNSPWLWLECDALPRLPHWANILHREYINSGKDFMGCMRPTPQYYPKGHPLEGQRAAPLAHDNIMSGVGIYPANFGVTSTLLRDLNHPNLNQPFDFWLRTEISGKAANTNVICDLWRTERFVKHTDGRITCSRVPGEMAVDGQPDEVNREAVIVHGCKDDSLADIVLGHSPEPRHQTTRIGVSTHDEASEQPSKALPKPNEDDGVSVSSEKIDALISQYCQIKDWLTSISEVMAKLNDRITVLENGAKPDAPQPHPANWTSPEPEQPAPYEIVNTGEAKTEDEKVSDDMPTLYIKRKAGRPPKNNLGRRLVKD